MPTIDQTIAALRSAFARDADIKEKLRQNPSDPLCLNIEDVIERHIREALEHLLKVPPHMLRHSEILPRFHANGTYDKSVFIMTKFPEGGRAG